MPKVAFRTVRNRLRFANYAVLKRKLTRTLDKVGSYFTQQFELVVADWDHQPDFKTRKFIRANKVWLRIYPAGDEENVQIYRWVTKGTKGGYKIPKWGPWLLSFQTDYWPKTKPRGKFGGPGIFTGPRVTFVGQVTHPGIEARDFEGVIAEDGERWFRRTMGNAWRIAIRKL